MVEWVQGRSGVGERWSSARNDFGTAKDVKQRAVTTKDPIKDFESFPANSSPAGDIIPTGIGAFSVQGRIVWWSGFQNSGYTNFIMIFTDNILTPTLELAGLRMNGEYYYRTYGTKINKLKRATFLPGDQTVPIDFYREAVGEENANAFYGFSGIAFRRFNVCENEAWESRIPIITAELVGNVSAESTETGYGTLNFGSAAGYSAYYVIGDSKRQRVYTMSTESGNYTLSGFDCNTKEEISSVILDMSYDPVGSSPDYSIMLPNTSYYFAYVDQSGSATNRIWDVTSGEMIAEYPPAAGDSGWALLPAYAVLLRSSPEPIYLIVGTYSYTADAHNDFGAVTFNAATQTFTELMRRNGPNNGGTVGRVVQDIALGPVSDGSATFYLIDMPDTHNSAYEVKMTENTVTWKQIYSTIYNADDEIEPRLLGIWYDDTDAKVVFRLASSDRALAKWNGTDFDYRISQTEFFTNAAPANTWFSNFNLGVEKESGFGYAMGGGDLFRINLSNATSELIADYNYNGFHYLSSQKLFFTNSNRTDDERNIYWEQYGDSTPDSINLTDVLTALAGIGDVDAADIEFSGFTGNEIYGYLIDQDTTSLDVMKVLMDVFNVTATQSDGKLKFRKMPTDSSYAIDVSLTDEEIVER